MAEEEVTEEKVTNSNRNEVHITRKVNTTSSVDEVGISLLSPSTSIEDLYTKAKSLLESDTLKTKK